MRRIISLILGIILALPVYGDTCGKSLVGVFTSFQATKLCSIFGSAVNHSVIPSADNTYDLGSSSLGWRTVYGDTSVVSPLITNSGDLQLRTDSDAQRLLTWGASSDTALTLTFGDAGVTATQDLTFSGSTADADDDSTLYVTSAGAAGVTRGAFARYNGNEVASVGGNAYVITGNTAGADLIFRSNDKITFEANNGTERFSLDTAAGGALAATSTGSTFAIDSGTAASACKGTGTHNGTTAVTVSTTCAATGMIVLHTNTSDPTGATAAQCWVTNIVNGTSFDIDCDQANDSTFSWIIIKEG